jgi:hypothetical protein
MQTALEWCFTGRVFGADEALERGLVRSVHAPAELLPAARALAREIADNSAPVSVALTRQMLWRMAGAEHPMMAHRVDSRAIQARGRSADAREGRQLVPGKARAALPRPRVGRPARCVPGLAGTRLRVTAAQALASSPPAPLLHQRPAIEPGLLILHGNRLELLGAAVFEWLRREPLAPLEEELILVPSNGMAEWVKMELATAHGACAATRVELPARFVWRAYRAVLGRGAVPPRSALDKLPLTWRLMRLLPQLAANPGSNRWPASWARVTTARAGCSWRSAWPTCSTSTRSTGPTGCRPGKPATTVLPRAGGAAAPVPADQQWQPALWRALQAELTSDERAATRPQLHQRFVQALAAGRPARGLPRRVVLFGTTHVPQPTLQAITALATHCQVLMAVPNPCRFHWADTIDGRELLRLQQRRQPLRGRPRPGRRAAAGHARPRPPAAVGLGPPGRDFVRQLDAFDDSSALRQRFGAPRVDLFDEQPAGQGTLLQQVQAGVRDLLPAWPNSRAARWPTPTAHRLPHRPQRPARGGGAARPAAAAAGRHRNAAAAAARHRGDGARHRGLCTRHPQRLRRLPAG